MYVSAKAENDINLANTYEETEIAWMVYAFISCPHNIGVSGMHQVSKLSSLHIVSEFE